MVEFRYKTWYGIVRNQYRRRGGFDPLCQEVDGPSIVQKAGNWTPRAGAYQPIHTTPQPAAFKAIVALEPAELQFLEYRLDVVTTWPECGRKRAALEAIYLKLNGYTSILA